MVFFCLGSVLHALPENPKVVHGSCNVETINAKRIFHSSDKSILEFNQFHIEPQETVEFRLPSSKSSVLSRVTGKNRSEILGSFQSNGQVVFINPNGVYFGKNAEVHVGSFIVSTLDIANEHFLEDRYQFVHSLDGIIQNDGLIEAETFIAMLAPNIENKGVIQGKLGSVFLGCGDQVTLDFSGDGMIQFSVEGPLKQACLEISGDLIAEQIISMKLPVVKQVLAELVNTEGLLEGDVFVEEQGVIKFVSAKVSGDKIHAFGPEVVLEKTTMSASEILLGGDFQGKGENPHSKKVLVDEESKLFSKEGLIVLWSTEDTKFLGSIVAPGSMVETSGERLLTVGKGATVNTQKEDGSFGTWLLDPSSIYVVTNGGDPSCDKCSDTDTCKKACDSDNRICYVSVDGLTDSSSDIVLRAKDVIGFFVPFAMNTTASLTLESCNSSGETLVSITDYLKTKSAPITFGAGTYLYNLFPVVISTTIVGDGADITIPLIQGVGTLTFDAGEDGVVSISNYPGYSLGELKVTSAKKVVTTGLNISGPITIDAPFQPGASNTIVEIPNTYSTYNVSFDSITGDGINSLTVKTVGSVITGPVTNVNGFSVQNGYNIQLNGDIDIKGDIDFSMKLADIRTGSLKSSQGSIYLNGSTTTIRSLELIAAGSVNFANLSCSGNLTVQGSLIAQKSSISASGIISYTASQIQATGTALSTAGSDITWTGSVALTGNAGLSSSTGTISLIGQMTGTSICTLTGNEINIQYPVSLPKLITNHQGLMTLFPGVTIQGSFIDNGPGSTLSYADVIITGSQIIEMEAPLTLGKSSTWVSSSSGTVELNSIEGSYDFILNAGISPVTILNANLSSLEVIGSSECKIGTLEAINNLSLNLPIVLVQDSSLQGGSITLGQTVTGGFSLEASGNTLYMQHLDVLSFTADCTSITLRGDSTWNAIDQISVTALIDGSVNWSVVAGSSVNLYEPVGSQNPLFEFSLTAPSAILSSILTQGGSIEIDSHLYIQGDGVVFNTTGLGHSEGANITTLNIDAVSGFPIVQSIAGSQGVVTLGQIGLILPVGGVTVLSGQLSYLSSIATAQGPIAIDIPITITTDVIFDTTAPGVGNGSIQLSDLTGLSNLTLNTSDGVSIYLEKMDLGSGDLTVNGSMVTAGSSINANNVYLNTSTYCLLLDEVVAQKTLSQIGTGKLQLSGNLTAENISLTGSAALRSDITIEGVDSVYAAGFNGNFSLEIVSQKEVNISAPMGNISALKQLTINSPLITTYSVYTTGGKIDLGNVPITLQSPTAFDTTDRGNFLNGGDITLGTVDGLYPLYLGAGSQGTIQIGAIGSGSPIGSLIVSGSQAFKLPEIRSMGQTVTIYSPVTLIENRTVEAEMGSIYFVSTIEGSTQGGQNLTLTAPLGDITLSRFLEPKLGTISIENVNNLYVGEIHADFFTQLAGSKLSTFAGPIELTNGLSLSGYQFSFESPCNLGLDGAVLMNADLLTIKSPFTLTGPFYQQGGLVLLESNLFITSDNQPLTMLGALEVQKVATVQTFGSVLFGSEITGAGDLLIDADTYLVTFGSNINFLGSLTVNSEALLEGSSFSIIRDVTFESPVSVTQNTSFDLTEGSIVFKNAVIDLGDKSNLSFFMGGGGVYLEQDVTGLGNILISNAGVFSAEQIVADSLKVTGGLANISINNTITLGGSSGIVLSGGEILLDAEISAERLFFKAYGSIQNINDPHPLSLLGTGSDYFNAIGGAVGSLGSPIEVNTNQFLIVGANPRADFMGTPFHGTVGYVFNNVPCQVTFNGVYIRDCTFEQSSQQSFNLISKTYFYLPGVYSSWDNFSRTNYEGFFNPCFNMNLLLVAP